MTAELLSRPSFNSKSDPSSSSPLPHLGYSLEGESVKTHKKFFSKKMAALTVEANCMDLPPHTMQDKLDAKPGMRLDHSL